VRLIRFARGRGRRQGHYGLFTGDTIAERRLIRALLGEARKLLEEMKWEAFAKGDLADFLQWCISYM
jgi:hypothetical protein